MTKTSFGIANIYIDCRLQIKCIYYDFLLFIIKRSGSMFPFLKFLLDLFTFQKEDANPLPDTTEKEIQVGICVYTHAPVTLNV